MNDALRKKLTEQQGQVKGIVRDLLNTRLPEHQKALDEKDYATMALQAEFAAGVHQLENAIIAAIEAEKQKKGRKYEQN